MKRSIHQTTPVGLTMQQVVQRVVGPYFPNHLQQRPVADVKH